MAYIDNTMLKDGIKDNMQKSQKESSQLLLLSQPCFLVNIVNKVELELLEELLKKNSVNFVSKNGSKKNRKRQHTRFAMLGKDIYVERAQYDRAKAVLADYCLGWDQSTAEVSEVPAARKQQISIAHKGKYSIKKLVTWLLIATVGYSLLFIVWMRIMNR